MKRVAQSSAIRYFSTTILKKAEIQSLLQLKRIDVVYKSYSEMELIIKDLTALPKLIPILLKEAATKKKWLFYGEVGAGKTTLIKELCAWFKVNESVTSPTYSIINEYEYIDSDGAAAYIYHMDLYRLKRIEEALDIGIEDHLDSEDYCFIEWPEIIEPIVPEAVLKISIEIVNDSERKIVIL